MMAAASTSANNSSSTSNSRFRVDDKVFAKVRGYPPWPAKVTALMDEIAGKLKYEVYFYGTGETAVCKQEELYDYVQCRDKYGKATKRKFFQEAIDQIEHDLNPSAPKPETTPNAAAISKNASITKENDVEANLTVEETPKKTTKGVKRKLSALTNDEPATGANESLAVSNESTPIGKGTSRSGRKIKPRKFSDDEEPMEVDQRASKPTNAIHKDNASTPQPVDYIDENESSDNDVDLSKISEDTAENGELRKTKRSCKENLKRHVEAIKQITFPDDENLELLRVEVQLLDSDCRIKSSLGLSRANCDECLRAMDEVLDLNLNALMLKKHPEVVDTVKKLRRYVGNLEMWKLNPEQEERFKQKAQKIRLKADHMYNKFKNLFTVPSGKSFLEVYNQEVSKFNVKIAKLTVNEVYGLVKEPED